MGNKKTLTTWLTLSACILLLGCEAGEFSEYGSDDHLGTQQQAIRNGTREPQILPLSGPQKMAVGWLHPRGRADANFCTATLVAPRVVATAKHCTDSQRNGIAFGIGLLPSSPAASFNVLSVHPHPRLDASILILEEDATQAGVEVRPIPFNRERLDSSIEGREVEAAGYGETYDRTRSGRYFAVVELRDVRSAEIIVDGRGQQGICFGDSGGPVMTVNGNGNVVVLAVESWGDPSCFGIDHLIRLDAIQDWIDDITGGPADGPIDDECLVLGSTGRCDGDILERCAGGEVTTIDCSAEDKKCEFVDDRTGYDCVEPDPCERVGSTGLCDGDTVVRCRFGEVQNEDCRDTDEVCLSDDGGAYCGPPPSESEPAPTAAEPMPDDSMPETADESDAMDDEELAMPMAAEGELKRGADGCQTTPGHETPAPWMFLMALPLLLRSMRKASIPRA